MKIFCFILAIMNSSIFIAKRLFTAKENNNNYTRPIIRIAILAIAISVAVMILSVFILSLFFLL
jgi:lipoprotein-releasing system permease protein